MSIHWKNLSTSEKVEHIKDVWEPGISASQIAEHFRGATRCAVAGFYSRNADHLKECPLRPRHERIVRLKVERSIRRKVPAFSATPLPQTDVPPVARYLALHELGPNECKFAVNDAAPGELHLFCGAPANGSYCDFHEGIAHRPYYER